MGRRQRRRHAARAAAFVDDHLPSVWRYVAGRLADPGHAAEVTRSVLGSVDPRLLSDDDETTLRRLVLTRARRAVAERDVAGPSGPPSAGAAPAWLCEGVAELDDDAREALVLLDVATVPLEEVAALWGISADEVLEHRRRAHEQLVARLVGGGS